MPYQNPSDPSDKDIVEAAKQYAEVDIGERELFDLEQAEQLQKNKYLCTTIVHRYFSEKR